MQAAQEVKRLEERARVTIRQIQSLMKLYFPTTLEKAGDLQNQNRVLLLHSCWFDIFLLVCYYLDIEIF